jgi:pyridoxamine 5'-phosphate oxidase
MTQSTEFRVAHLRKEYSQHALLEEQMPEDPLDFFQQWLQEAVESDVNEPNAMTLATVRPDGAPSARIVLLKGVDHGGFSFFTNYQSEKGQELEHSAAVSLVFLWHELERQIRIDGRARKLSPEESDNYFQSRPRGSRIGAWASPQSRVLQCRDEVKQLFEAQQLRFEKATYIPRPPHWGGYRVHPERVEFWQGRPNRMHDRVRYVLENEGRWRMQRLAP